MFVELAIDCVKVGLVGALLSLDRTGAFQVMVSRPLVSAPLVGALLGYGIVGLGVGVLIELLYMADRPVGGYMPTHETALAVLATAATAAFIAGAGESGAVAFGLSRTLAVVAPILLISILVAPIFRISDVFSRRMNEGLFEGAPGALNSGNGSAASVQRENIKGLFNFFWPLAAMLFVSVLILSSFAFFVGARFGAFEAAKFYPSAAVFLILAIALALNAIKARGTLIVFSVSGALTAFILIVLR